MTTKLFFDGRSITSEADFHDAIDRAARDVGFAWYGRNLDALGDVFEQIVSLLHDAEHELGSSFHLVIEP